METIVEYYCFVFLLPALLGVAMRCGLQRTRKAIRYTGLCVFLMMTIWVATWFIPNHGSEGYGILALMGSAYAMGMIFVEITVYFLKKWRSQRK